MTGSADQEQADNWGGLGTPFSLGEIEDWGEGRSVSVPTSAPLTIEEAPQERSPKPTALRRASNFLKPLLTSAATFIASQSSRIGAGFALTALDLIKPLLSAKRDEKPFFGVHAAPPTPEAAEPNEGRFADVRLFRRRDDTRGVEVGKNERLVLNHPYLVEVAIRTQRIGITAGTPIEPVRTPSGTDVVLVVALWGDPDEIDIFEPVGELRLPSIGDSNAIYFTFTPRRMPAGGAIELELRIYYRLNLVEWLVFEAEVSTPGETLSLSSAQRIAQRQVQRRYEGDLEAAFLARQLHIHISQDRDEYRLAFTFVRDEDDAEQPKLHTRTPLTAEDLRQELERIRDKWLNCALEAFGNNLEANATISRQARRDLAIAGANLWALLFRHGPAKGSLRVIERQLLEHPLPKEARIQITIDRSARDFVFPWALLYDGAIGEDTECEPHRFWGLRYVIEQQLTSDMVELPDDSDSTTARKLSLGFMLYNRLTHSASQRKLLDAMAKESRGKLVVGKSIESRKEFLKVLVACDLGLLYFFCHGFTRFASPAWLEALRRQLERSSAGGNQLGELATLLKSGELGENESWIKLTKSKITLSELYRSPSDFRGRPIVILNMCQSAQVLPRVTDSFVGYFLKEGARSVVGTECPIPPVFAHVFARELLRRLFRGDSLGAALLQARCYFVDAFDNPLGLAYTLWGSGTAGHRPPVISSVEVDRQIHSSLRKELPG